MFYSSITRNQDDGVMILAKHSLIIEFSDYDFVDANILKFYIWNSKVPINLICVYRSPISDSDNFMNYLLKVIIDDSKLISAITVLTGDMSTY